jgi:hypothetical protein
VGPCGGLPACKVSIGSEADRPAINRLTGRTIVYSKSGNSPEHDGLLLPTGKTVGETSTEELRPILARFGVENPHTAGRAVIVAEYARVIGEVYSAAGMAALKQYLKDKDNA